MRIVGERIQKKIPESMAREMLLVLHSRGEYQAASISGGIDTMACGFLAQICLGRGIVSQQPKDDAFDAFHQTQP